MKNFQHKENTKGKFKSELPRFPAIFANVLPQTGHSVELLIMRDQDCLQCVLKATVEVLEHCFHFSTVKMDYSSLQFV